MRFKYNSLKCHVFIAIILVVGILYQSFILFQNVDFYQPKQEFYFPYDSFAYITIDVDFQESPTGEENIIPDISTRGSGIVIGTTENQNAAVLTANHVCNPAPFLSSLWNTSAEKNITITDFHGNTYTATILLTNMRDDLCLLEVEGFVAPGVRLANEEVFIGEKVYNVASPMAFFSPGMVPLLDGYYSGDVYSSSGIDSVYTVPAQAGSSGSAVLNKDGEIIGVIHSALSNYEHVAICSTLEQVTSFLLEFESSLNGTLAH